MQALDGSVMSETSGHYLFVKKRQQGGPSTSADQTMNVLQQNGFASRYGLLQA